MRLRSACLVDQCLAQHHVATAIRHGQRAFRAWRRRPERKVPRTGDPPRVQFRVAARQPDQIGIGCRGLVLPRAKTARSRPPPAANLPAGGDRLKEKSLVAGQGQYAGRAGRAAFRCDPPGAVAVAAARIASKIGVLAQGTPRTPRWRCPDRDARSPGQGPRWRSGRARSPRPGQGRPTPAGPRLPSRVVPAVSCRGLANAVEDDTGQGQRRVELGKAPKPWRRPGLRLARHIEQPAPPASPCVGPHRRWRRCPHSPGVAHPVVKPPWMLRRARCPAPAACAANRAKQPRPHCPAIEIERGPGHRRPGERPGSI